MYPALQAEMDTIMDLHRQARGPSLFEQHRLKKSVENAEANKGGKAEWMEVESRQGSRCRSPRGQE
jgi:hypothetical protein